MEPIIYEYVVICLVLNKLQTSESYRDNNKDDFMEIFHGSFFFQLLQLSFVLLSVSEVSFSTQMTENCEHDLPDVCVFLM